MPPNGDRCTNTEHVSYLYRCIKQLPIAKIINNRATFLQIYSEILIFVIFNLCMFLNLIFKVENIKCKESTRFWERGTRSTEPHRKYQTWYNSTRFGNPGLHALELSDSVCNIAWHAVTCAPISICSMCQQVPEAQQLSKDSWNSYTYNIRSEVKDFFLLFQT